MARFTKEAMLEELRTILLFEADHILMGRGSDVASAFIGFDLGDESEHVFLNPSKVDLGLFPISATFIQGYDYAFNPSPLNASDGSEVQDLHVFMEATPRAGGIGSGGETHAFMSAEGLCRQVADASMARWKLDDHESDLTVREIALLADMSEGAVRNALSIGGEGGLQAIKGSKPLMVNGSVALKWLQSRRGFVATPTSAKDDAFLAEQIASAATSNDLASLVCRQAWISFGHKDAEAELGVQSWDEVRATILAMDMVRVQAFAEKLDFDVPTFVGKAAEVAVRDRLAEARS